MTLADTTFAPPATPGTIGRVVRLALPLMVGAVAAAGLHIAKVGLLTHQGDDAAVYTLSMVQPAFILMLAFLESLAIANQVFSSKSVANWPRGDVARATRAFSVLGLVLVALLTAGFLGADALVDADRPVAIEALPQMGWFVASLSPYMLFELRNAALRGQGRTLLALAPFGVLIAADLGATWISVTRFDLGFEAVLIGNVVGPLVALPLVSILLARTVGGAPRGDTPAFRKHIIGMAIGVAGPVFLTMIAGSASAAVIFPALAMLGSEPASAFLLVVRMRILFMIPAIATGSAIAILVNQMPERGHAAEKRRVLLGGVGWVLATYAVATLALWWEREAIVGLLAPPENAALHAATVEMTTLLIATFFLIAAYTMIQVILEHLGHGMKALAATATAEAATIGLCIHALRGGHGIEGITFAMTVVAGFAMLLFAAAFGAMIRKLGRADAV